MLKKLGIENTLQLAITICVVTLVLITPLGGSGGAPPVFFIYRTALLAITILCAIAYRNAEQRISRMFTGLVSVSLALMLVSMFRIQGSHFEGFYLWYKHAFFICALISLAWYSRYQPARWRGFLLFTVIAGNVVHLIPDLVMNHRPVASFSPMNPNYFGTFLLIGFASSLAVAVFGTDSTWRAAAGAAAALLFFGITQTWSRGATLAAIAVVLVSAIRAHNRIPRRVWILAGVLAVVIILITSPYLVRKFFDRGQSDPYNYVRTEVWINSLPIIAQHPFLGVGFGQYANASKRYAFPVEGQVARYLKRAQMAHSEYLQHVSELGIPAAVLMLSLLLYTVYLAWKRAPTAWPEYRCFQEAAIATAVGLGAHGLVDNCWTIPVTASGIVVIALADILPLEQRVQSRAWPRLQQVFAGLLLGGLYVHSILIPAAGFYYNEMGHQAYDKLDYTNAERFHLAAISVVPDHPQFLDNLGMVYLQQSEDLKKPELLGPARHYFARAIASSPQSIDSHIHMETVLVRSMTGQFDRDLAIYKDIAENDSQLLRIDPFIPFVRKNLADAMYYMGQREQAFQELQKAIDYEPNYVPGYLEMASWYKEMGKTSESDRYTGTAIAIVNKYREFKPREPYEGILLGRPQSSWAR